MDLEQPCGIGGRLVTPGHHPTDLGLLLRRQLRTTPADASFPTGGIQTGLRSFAEHGPFEFGERPDHLHHHPSCRRCGVDRLGQAAEASFGFTQPFHDREDIAQRAGQPVELPHHEHVSFAELIEEPVEFGPVPPSAGSLLAINPLTSGRLGLRLGVEKVVHHWDDDGYALHQCHVGGVGQDGQSRCGARLHVAVDLATL